jgi:hypothetical protein
MSEFKLDEAQQYLQKAKATGIKEAVHNLGILDELRKNTPESDEDDSDLN